MSDETKVLVGLCAADHPGGAPTIILGVTPAAWNQMANGNTHTFDMTKVGVPVQILMFRGETHEELAGVMASGAAFAGASFEDHRGKNGKLPDLGIDEPTKQ